MTAAQKKLYFAEWNEVRRILRRQGMSPAEADAMRHELHRQALGYARSSSDFTNAELDEVLKKFRSLSQATNLEAQLANGQLRRHLWKIESLCEQMGKPIEYAEAIAKHMARERQLPSGDLVDLQPKHLRYVIAALTYQAGGAKRPSRKKVTTKTPRHEEETTAAADIPF